MKEEQKRQEREETREALRIKAELSFGLNLLAKTPHGRHLLADIVNIAFAESLKRRGIQ